MAESLSVEMPVTASEYQSLILRIKELEEIVAELKKDNEEKAKIIADQAKIIAQQTKQIEELKAKLVRYENPHTPSSFCTTIQEKIRAHGFKKAWCSRWA